jgi:hypothetical protein
MPIEHDGLLFENESDIEIYESFKKLYSKRWKITIAPSEIGAWEVMISDENSVLIHSYSIGYSSLPCDLNYHLSNIIEAAILKVK